MHANANSIIQSLESLKARLHEAGILYDWNPSIREAVRHGVSRVTWATNGTRPDLSGVTVSNISEYLAFLAGRHFQFQLTDGSLIQMSYDIRNQSSEVVSSRLVWYPCPIEFSQEELTYASLEEMILSSPTELLSLQAPLRFDFAPHQIGPNHSATHLHMGKEDFRLPVQRAMEPSRFMRLVIRTAYPQVWEQTELFNTVENWGAQDRLSADDQSCGALTWTIPVA
ncbi:DUF2290 domain-containing protein [Massilia sp. TS11]|uniref:DUF2290 domain-containing protein n=1 Tax=Massilia sp. TS11 TaxID=2908003 RepID=UPI0035A33A11